MLSYLCLCLQFIYMIFINSQSIINSSLTNLVQSRWLEISLVPFFAILWTLTLSLIELGKYSAMLTSCLVNNANIRETDLYHSKHANISTCSFAGSTSTNPTQCRILNNWKWNVPISKWLQMLGFEKFLPCFFFISLENWLVLTYLY